MDNTSRGYVRGKWVSYIESLTPEQRKAVLEYRGDDTIGDPALYQQPVSPEVAPAVNARQQARQQGYTGNQCSQCSGVRMKVSGHCEVCEDCGTTTGCS